MFAPSDWESVQHRRAFLPRFVMRGGAWLDHVSMRSPFTFFEEAHVSDKSNGLRLVRRRA